MKAYLIMGLIILALGGAFLLTACDADLSGDAGPDPTAGSAKKRRDPVYTQSVFGEGGLSLGSDDIGGTGAEPTTGVGVNTFLWRASLDTLSFMPAVIFSALSSLSSWLKTAKTPSMARPAAVSSSGCVAARSWAPLI